MWQVWFKKCNLTVIQAMWPACDWTFNTGKSWFFCTQKEKKNLSTRKKSLLALQMGGGSIYIANCTGRTTIAPSGYLMINLSYRSIFMLIPGIELQTLYLCSKKILGVILNYHAPRYSLANHVFPVDDCHVSCVFPRDFPAVSVQRTSRFTWPRNDAQTTGASHASHLGDCCPSAYSSGVSYVKERLHYYRPMDSNRQSD